MLLSIAYAMDGDTFMAEKYKAISNLMQLRSLERVGEVGTSRETLVPKASALMCNVKAAPPTSQTPALDESQEKPGPTNEVESAPGYGNVRLSPEEQDEVLIGLAEYLLDENMAEFAKSCI